MQDNINLEKNYSSKQVFLLMLLAYLFGVICRFYWVYWASDIEEFKFNGEFITITNDSLYSAEGARDMLAGFHQPNDLSPYGSSMSTFTFILNKILPFKFETIIFYMSVFLSPLIVVPIILIAREYKIVSVGVVAGLIASVLPIHYMRTLAGYYDSDMLILIFSLLVVWALIRLVRLGTNFILPSIFMILYSWWYPSSFSLNLATIIIFLFYTLVFDRKNDKNHKAIILMMIAILRFEIYFKEVIVANYILLLKVALVGSLYALMSLRPRLFDKKMLLMIMVAVVVALMYFGGFVLLYSQVEFYITRSEYKAETFHFYDVTKTIIEVKKIPFDEFMELTAGHFVTFIIATIGIILMLIKFRTFWFMLPMIGLGYLSFFGGIRFAMYIVPAVAFGFSYALFALFYLLDIREWLRKSLIYICACLALLPNLEFIYEYRVPVLLGNNAISGLDLLKKGANREDYVMSWWDYGYLIRYYADVKTLADPGYRQSGIYNFLTSFALSENQTSSANMTRLNVEYNERQFSEKFDLSLSQMLKDYDTEDVNKFLKSLDDKNFKLPQKTRDVYYYLLPEMISILPQIFSFSMLDITTGQEFEKPLVHIGVPLSSDESGINIGGGIILPVKDLKFITRNGEKLPINSYYEVSYERDKLSIKENKVDENAQIYVIFLKHYDRILILEKKAFDSAFIQLFVLENYDKELFEPIFLHPSAKIYKLLK